MKIENRIGWCDDTINIVTGCDKITEECKNCYAATGTRARVLRERGLETWGPKGQRVPVEGFVPKVSSLSKKCVCDSCHEAAPYFHLATGVACMYCGGTMRRIRLFADSNSDWLDPKWSAETRLTFLDTIKQWGGTLEIQILTKRIELLEQSITDAVDWGKKNDFPTTAARAWLAGNIPENVWLGVSAGNQKRLEERLPELMKWPATLRWVSAEPLLSTVKILGDDTDLPFEYAATGHLWSESNCRYEPVAKPKLHWIVVGGESGPDALRRDCDVEDIEKLVSQCALVNIPCYPKQDSGPISGLQGRISKQTWAKKQMPR